MQIHPFVLNQILFALHGLIDTNQNMGSLAHQVASSQTYVVAPTLGVVNTLFEIEPLVDHVEHIATQTFQEYPDLPARIIAHSLGGVIWVEVLSRHPEWWPRFESMVLLGSPLGGADLAKIVDQSQCFLLQRVPALEPGKIPWVWIMFLLLTPMENVNMRLLLAGFIPLP